MARRDERYEDAVEEAWELLTRGDLDGALAAADRATERDDSSEGLHVRGHVLTAFGRLDEALEMHQAALAMDPSFREAMVSAAEVLIAIGRFGEGAAMAEEALELAETEHDRLDILLLLVDTMLAEGHVEQARELVDRFPEEPQEPELEFLAARARYDVGDPEGASAGIELAARTFPADPEVQYYLGLIREGLGDLVGATAAFLQCRQLDLAIPPVPFARTPEAFESEVAASIKALPAEDRASLDGALVLVEPLPGAEVVSEGVDPRLPMVVDSYELDEGVSLRRLFVYQRNIERLLSRPDDLRPALKSLLRDAIGKARGREAVAAD